MRVFVKKSLDIRHYYKQICISKHRNICRKRIVLAHFKLQLINRHRIVLVHNRDRTKLYNAVKGVLHIYASVLKKNILCKQKLSHIKTVFREKIIVKIHKLTLTHRRTSLSCGSVLGSFLYAQLCSAKTHRTA